MAVVNGKLDTALLRDIPGGRLDILAADSWMRVRDEVHRRFGYVLAPTSYVDTYRPYEVQERIFRQRYTTEYVTGIDPRRWLGQVWWRKPIWAAAAVPGTSNHGLGVAIDVAYMGGFGSAKYAALTAVGPGHGWDNNEGRSIAEPWHWRYRPANDQHRTAPAPEDDMPLTTADLDAISQRVHAVAVENIIRGAEFRAMLQAQVGNAVVALLPQIAAAVDGAISDEEVLQLVKEQQARNVGVLVPAIRDAILAAMPAGSDVSPGALADATEVAMRRVLGSLG